MIALVLSAASIVGTAMATWVAVFIVAPWLVHILGSRRFAEVNGLDGCGYVVYGTVIGGLVVILLPVFSKARAKAHHVSVAPTPLWIYAAIPALAFLLVTVFAVMWLALQAVYHRRTEFVITPDGSIRGKKGILLSPTVAQQDNDYFQTDAFRGYSWYKLTLYNKSQKLATNVYMAEEARTTDLQRVVSTDRSPTCRSLDLRFVWRESPLQWLAIMVSPDWSLYLCQPEAFFSEEGVSFWHSLTLPDFPTQERCTISPEELRTRIAELESAIPALRAGKATERLNSEWKLLMQFANRVEGGVIPVTSAGFEELATEAAGGPAVAIYSSDDGERFHVRIERQDKPASDQKVSDQDGDSSER